MKKPSLSDALATKVAPPTPDAPALTDTAPSRKSDNRTTTTLRIDPDWLEALKIIAAKKRTRVNDLLLEGAAHVLAINGHKVSRGE